MTRRKFSVLTLCFLSVLSASSVMAQTAPSGTSLFNRDVRPFDINSVPILSTLVKNGTRLYFLGERSGLQGWFIVKDGQVQMIYVTPDKQTALIGGMFSSEGDNITGPQIETLAKENKEVGDIVNGAARQQEDITRAGSAPGGVAAVPGSALADAGKSSGNTIPTVSLSPGERLLQDLQAAAGVTLGKNDNAELLLVLDPNNARCKATWRELSKPVKEGRVQVRIIPVSKDPVGDEARVGAQLLKAAAPFEAWDKYASGDTKTLAGTADSVQLAAVEANNKLLKKWNIAATPYIVYRAKDGRVKIVQGEPERMAPVLSDLPK
jgi:hypothetical protein